MTRTGQIESYKVDKRRFDVEWARRRVEATMQMAGQQFAHFFKAKNVGYEEMLELQQDFVPIGTKSYPVCLDGAAPGARRCAGPALSLTRVELWCF